MKTNPGRRPPRLATLFGSLIGIGGLVAVVISLDADLGQALALVGDLDLGVLVLALPLAIVSKGMVGAVWRSVLEALGSRAPLPSVLRWYYVGSMGKYLPGGVWPVLGRGELAASGGIARAVAYPSVAVSMMLTFMSAALTALLFLPWALAGLRVGTETGTLGTALWSLLVLPAGVAVLHPAVGGRALRWGVGRFRREKEKSAAIELPPPSRLALLTVAHIPFWLLVGVTQLLVTAAVAQSAGVEGPGVASLFAATSLAWLGGFLALPVPSGLGVREAIFVAALPGLGPEVALAAALVGRLVFVAGDAIAAVGALVMGGAGGLTRSEGDG